MSERVEELKRSKRQVLIGEIITIAIPIIIFAIVSVSLIGAYTSSGEVMNMIFLGVIELGVVIATIENIRVFSELTSLIDASIEKLINS